MPFYNADGLYVRYGAEKVKVLQAGEYQGAGENRVLEFEIDPTILTTTSQILAHGFIIPRNSTIEQVEVVAEVITNNITSISVGAIRLDEVTFIGGTEVSFLSAFPIANLTPAGKKTILNVGSTNAGDQLGKVFPQAGLLTAKIVGTPATTGRIIVRIKIYVANQETIAQAIAPF